MDKRMSEALDRHITGNYGEDQFRGISPQCLDYDCDHCEDCNCACHNHNNDCRCDNCIEARANVEEWIRDSKD